MLQQYMWNIMVYLLRCMNGYIPYDIVTLFNGMYGVYLLWCRDMIGITGFVSQFDCMYISYFQKYIYIYIYWYRTSCHISWSLLLNMVNIKQLCQRCFECFTGKAHVLSAVVRVKRQSSTPVLMVYATQFMVRLGMLYYCCTHVNLRLLRCEVKCFSNVCYV